MDIMWGVQQVGNTNYEQIVLFYKKKHAKGFKKRVQDLNPHDPDSYNKLELEIIQLKIHDNMNGVLGLDKK
jgi:hypothetical protein